MFGSTRKSTIFVLSITIKQKQVIMLLNTNVAVMMLSNEDGDLTNILNEQAIK